MSVRSLVTSATLGAIVLGAAACGGPVRTERSFEALGRPVHVELYTATGRGAEQLIEQIASALERADREFGGAPGGELARLNRSATTATYAVQSRDLYGCIKLALDWARATDGTFDPVTGGGMEQIRLFQEAQAVRLLGPSARVELDGIFEGCALDLATRNFARAGTRAGLVGFADVQYAWMPPPGSETWRVPIRDPQRRERTVFSVEALNRAVAAVGTFDRATADLAPFDTVVGAAVVADTGADAQVIATALSAMGSNRAGGLLERTRRTEAVLLVRSPEGVELLVSASLRERFEIEESYRAELGDAERFILPPLEFP